MSGLPYLKQLDRRQLFRLFVDGRYQKRYEGWRGYEEKERGSTLGMLNGLAYVLDHFDLSDGLTSHYVARLHRACMSNVETRVSRSTPGELRYRDTGFQFFAASTTIDGMREVLEIRRGDGRPVFHLEGIDRPAEELDAQQVLAVLERERRLRYRPWFPDLDRETSRALDRRRSLPAYYAAKAKAQTALAERLQAIVDAFNADMPGISGDRAKLERFARLVKHLELLHPFPDGNCRTCATLLLNHLLMYHGFPPAMLEDPNRDAQFSYAEFADDIEKGMERTRALIADPGREMFGYGIAEQSGKDTRRWDALAESLYDKIAAA